MKKPKFTTIIPENNFPDLAIKLSADTLPESDRTFSVEYFFLADAVADGMQNDFAFVLKIPGFIEDIIDNKAWQRLYVSKGVVSPYYCCFTRGNDVENFKAFVEAPRPNGLGTTIESLDLLLQLDPEIRKKFRDFVNG